jgi:hypothetical protein
MTRINAFRAAYWQSDDAQSDLLLTGPQHAHLPVEELMAEARAELTRAGGTEDGGRIIVGEWQDDT